MSVGTLAPPLAQLQVRALLAPQASQVEQRCLQLLLQLLPLTCQTRQQMRCLQLLWQLQQQLQKLQSYCQHWCCRHLLLLLLRPALCERQWLHLLPAA